MTQPTLSFLGGARTVTGSRFLVEHAGRRVLVDCGLFQGRKELRLANWAPLPVDAASIDAVVLTHAHVDHCGYLPRLVREGFAGHAHATPDTRRLCDIVLPDSGHLQEEEAAFANRIGFSKHHPALPLYTEADARAALPHLANLPFGTPTEVAPGVEVELRRSGHILGSAVAVVRLRGGPTVVVSGDLGRPSHPLLSPPEPLAGTGADWIVVESTYGDRRHDDARAVELLAGAVTRTAARGGTVVIPAFAVDRTEVMLFHLARLTRSGAIPRLPIYVDSPMASASLRVYRAAVEAGHADVRPGLWDQGDPFDPGTLHEVRSPEESKHLDTLRYPCIIVSPSGMATGGRVLHHLTARLPDRRSTVVLVGFQAEGTRGRLLVDGARQLKLLGRYVPVRAEVVDLPTFSVHADRAELLDWLGTADRAPHGVFVVHGEEHAARSLRDALMDRFEWPAIVPHQGERVRLDPMR